MAGRIGLALSVTLLCLSVYLFTFGGKFYSIDEELYLRMTQSIVRNHSFAIQPIEYAEGFSTEEGLDGRFYANRGPGFPLVAVPFFMLGDALTQFGPGYTEPSLDGIGEPTVFTVSLTLANALIVALTVLVLFATIARLGFSTATAAAVSLLFGLGTMAWPYASKSFFAEPLLMLCTLGSFYWALRYRLNALARRQASYLFLTLSALCLGYAIWVKVTGLILVPFLALYLLSASLESGIDRSRLQRAAIAFVVIVGLFVALLAYYNYARFGSFFKTGYEAAGQGSATLLIGSPLDLSAGLYGPLLSPGKGLLFHAIPVVLAIVGVRRFWSDHRSEAVFLLGVSLATIVGVALWRDWSGGWCWGPRLILNVLPLMMIPAAAIVEPLLGKVGWRRLIWPAFLAVGVVTQLIGVLPDYLGWYLEAGDYNLVYYNPLYSPLRGHLEAILSGRVDLFWPKMQYFFPGAGALMVVIPAALVALALASYLHLVYHWRTSVSKEVANNERGDTSR